MTLNDLANIGTTLGALFGAASLLSGFLLYRFSQDEAFSSNTKRLLTRSREACRQLNLMVTFDLAHEITHTVVFSPSVTFELKKVWERFFANAEEGDRSVLKDELQEYMKKEFPGITVPVDTSILRTIDGVLKETQGDLAYVYNDFPGLYRVISPILTVLSNIVRVHKSLSRDDGIWEELLPNIYEVSKLSSLEDLQYEIQKTIIVGLQQRVRDHDQADIDDLLELLGMTIESYISLDTRKLKRISGLEKKDSYKPIMSSETISDDLREAETAVKRVLTEDALLKYRELVVKFEQRNS
jgi:hypothetical protein